MNRVINSFVEHTKMILGDDLVGIYLHGSSVMGCYNPAKSDIDLIVVVKDPISDAVKRAYMDMVAELNGKGPAKGIEMSIVRQDVCRPFVYPTPFELHFSAAYLDWYSRDPDDYVSKMNGEDKDLAAHFTIIRHRGKRLCGAPIKEVFADVPMQDYVDSIWNDIADAEEEIMDHPMYLILNLARVLAFLWDGLVLSKKEGGQWALHSLPERYHGLIQDALREYVEGTDLSYDGDLGKGYAGYMLGEIERAKSEIYRNERRRFSMERTTEELKASLRELVAKMLAYKHAQGVLYYDAATIAPPGGAADRGKTLAVLSEVSYELQTGEETGKLLTALMGRLEELDPVTRREVTELWRDYERTKKIPKEEFIAYNVLLNEADAVWHKAKVESDWPAFRPYMEKIVEFNKKLAGWLDPGKKPYDALLDQYERGLTMETLDKFFAVLKERLVPLIRQVVEKGQPDCAFIHREFPIEQQRKLSDWLMAAIGIDREYCSIGETEHPFTDGYSKHDVRITTHYHLEDPLSSLFSVVHEGGHALYELHTGDELQDTLLAGGASMSIHESQSRFFENIIGRSRGFIHNLLPELRELFPAQMEGVTEEMLYRAANIAEPGLIRTEADELSYCLHVMLRYELEKQLMDGSLAVADLPAAWNRKMKEYLGLDVPDDRRGVLQDSHWSGGSIGYFPSYALGSAYGAQLLAKMKETLDVDAIVASGDLKPILRWLTERIWKKGSLYDPQELFEQAAEAPFDPTYYTDYLKEKYSELYGL